MAGHPIPLATIRAATEAPDPELAIADPMDCTASDRVATFMAFIADCEAMREYPVVEISA
jgi:hypothetical protein